MALSRAHPAAQSPADERMARPRLAGGPWARVAAAAHNTDSRWVGGLLLAIVAVTGLPYALAAAVGPRDLQRTGTFWFVQDFSQYAAAMREGASSPSWLVRDHLTAESHAPALMYPLYVGLGKAARLLGLEPQALYPAAEWVGRLALVLAVAWFASAFLAERKARRLAVLLTFFTLGLAGWAIPYWLLFEAGAGVAPAVNVFLELNSFGVLFAAPHLMLGLALTLACAPLALAARGPRGRLAAAALAAATLALSWLHPFNLPVLLSVLLLDGLLAARAARAWRPLRPAMLAGATAAPGLLYSAALFSLDPFWAGTYSAQNLMPSPPPGALPVDLGVVLLAAPLAWPAVRRWAPERRRLLLVWVGLGLLWMYAPLPYQRRFGFGVQPGLAVLGAAGLLALNGWMRQRRWGGLPRRLVNYGVAFSASLTLVLTYASVIASAATNAPVPVYPWSVAEARAALWLAERTGPADVVLVSTAYGNPLAGAIDGRVVSGHPVATRDSSRKAALVARFFSAQATPDERAALLRESGATVVGVGPRERALGGGSLADMPELQPLGEGGGVEWFRVSARAGG